MLTVRQALKIPPLDRATVVGGKEGLDRKVQFVNIMEVPDVGRWMKGGEFLVTAGFALHEEPALIGTIMKDLENAGVSAFGIKLGPYLQSIPEELIREADRLKLPLIELPGVPYMDFMIPIFENLMSQQYQALKRAEETHEQLIELALRGEGIAGICRTVEQLVRNPVLIMDKVNNCISRSPDRIQNKYGQNVPGWENDIVNFLVDNVKFSRLSAQRVNRMNYDGESELYVVPVQVHGSVENVLVCWEKFLKLDDISLRALENAATVVALEQVKERAILENEQQIRGELLEDLIWNNYKSKDMILKRASFCRLNVNARLAVFIIDIDEFDAYLLNRENASEEQVQQLKQDVIQYTRFILTRQMGHPPLLYQRSDNVVGLISLNGKKDTTEYRDIFVEIQEYLQNRYHLQVSVGVGRANVGMEDLKQSYDEAMLALRVGRFLHGDGSISFFQELGPYSFLCDLRDSEFMQGFYNETLGKLHTFDQQNRGDLVRTLQAYFESGRNLRVTAEKLFLHRNSVIYRLKKVEEVTGMQLDNPEDQFRFQLALRVGNVLFSG